MNQEAVCQQSEIEAVGQQSKMEAVCHQSKIEAVCHQPKIEVVCHLMKNQIMRKSYQQTTVDSDQTQLSGSLVEVVCHQMMTMFRQTVLLIHTTIFLETKRVADEEEQEDIGRDR